MFQAGAGNGSINSGPGNGITGVTTATFTGNTLGTFLNNFNSSSGGPVPTGTGPLVGSSAGSLTGSFVAQPLLDASAILPVYGPPMSPSITPPGTNAPAGTVIEADLALDAFRVFSPFSLVALVPPQTLPPRAVTLFAPSGGGAAMGAAPAEGQANPAPGTIPGAPPRPGNPGKPPTPGTINPNSGSGPMAPSNPSLPFPGGSADFFRDQQPPAGAADDRGIFPPNSQTLSAEQSSDPAAPSGTQSLEVQMPPPPVHAPDHKGGPAD